VVWRDFRLFRISVQILNIVLCWLVNLPFFGFLGLLLHNRKFIGFGLILVLLVEFLHFFQIFIVYLSINLTKIPANG